MKSLIGGILIITALGTPACTTSNDAIKTAHTKLVELKITLGTPTAEAKKTKQRVENFATHALCSGAFVNSSGLIMTAKHCTEGTVGITVRTSDGQEYDAVVVRESKTHDLALIHIDRFNTPYFILAKQVAQGEAIYVLGSPLGIAGTISTGIVAKLNGDITLVDCGVLPGNSGGPVFNGAGELVGVATAGFIVMGGTTHLNIIQSIDAIRGFAVDLGGK